ncbi:MAG: hypothetical protein A4E69_01760 [Syntrophus sp. PtaB.Bin138]|jgi:hypothetical protein|nr:MAG: hypothetical protein A4E69_01760 [Syntrophus sp. PtaB.Bin138]OPY36626.1 MAG: hypothetical protein A4E34_00190 [Methanoregula sp. PtaU1.Bin006]HNX18433.1 hypothetical protein [Methanoregula sp.]
MFVSTGSRPFRSHHLAVFWIVLLIGWTPLACRAAPAPAAARPRSSHTAEAEYSSLLIQHNSEGKKKRIALNSDERFRLLFS